LTSAARGEVSRERPTQDARLTVCVWAVMAMVLINVRGKELELDRDVTARLRYHAIPVGMSMLYQHHPHDYTGRRYIAIRFQRSDMALEKRIAWAALDHSDEDRSTHYWLADDRGMADYVVGAFALFGPSIRSLYHFYFVVLSGSVALFLLAYRSNRSLLGLLLLALGATYATLSAVPLASLSPAFSEPPTLFEPRMLDLLALIATIHLAFAGWTFDRPRGWTAALVGQLFIFLFCYHARSSLGWEALFIGLMNTAAIAAAGWPYSPLQFARVRTAAAPLLCVLAGLVALSAYIRVMYNPRYFQDLGRRTVWHNALMGLGSNPTLSAKYKIGINDAAVVDAVLKYLHERRDSRMAAGWDTTNILNSLGGYSDFNWYTYETAARDLYAQIWRDHPVDALHCYLVDKPAEVWSVLSAVALTRPPNPGRKNDGLYLRPFSIVAISIAFPGMVMLAGHPPRRLLLPTALLALCGAIPALIFYAAPLTMMGMFAAVCIVAYVGVSEMSVRAVHLWQSRTAARAADAYL
jgi:hypothetical protein